MDCPKCGGECEPETCDYCGGQGFVSEGDSTWAMSVTCGQCCGEGTVYECLDCGFQPELED